MFTAGNDQIKEWGEELVNQVTFYGNKVVNMGKEKDTAWFEAYKELVKTVIDFIVPKNETICDWTGSQAGEGAQAFFE